MKVRYRVVERIADELLSKNPDLFIAPVDVNTLAGRVDIHVLPRPLPEDLSGASMIEGAKKIITYNEGHADTRARFTIAHELGHLLLHQDSTLNISNGTPVIFYRNDDSSKGTAWREIEANHFAACLLMPQKLVIREVDKVLEQKNISDADIDVLATKFGVSSQAMGIRLGSLGLMF